MTVHTDAHDPLPLPLPSVLVPDGCPAWDGEAAHRWTRALPPRGVPGRPGDAVTFALSVGALLASGALHLYAALPPWAAALAALHLLWPALRPEVVPLSAPLTAALLLVPARGPLTVRIVLAGVLAVLCAAVVARLVARRRQRAEAEAAAGGAAAVVPGTGAKVVRGRFLTGAGVLVAAAGAALSALGGSWDLAEDRQVTPALAWCLVGLGLTVLLSGVLGRRRAAALRTAPVPVLRVLVRETADTETEVFAADDAAALRPLFTVATSSHIEDDDDNGDGDGDGEGDEGEAGRDEDAAAAEAEWQALMDRFDDEQPGPLREAVLYGAPWEGAEVLIVSAAERPDEPPLTEGSTGPVRPLSGHAARRRADRGRRAAADDLAGQERLSALAAAAPDREVRQWRAGPRDWASTLGAAAFACLLVSDESGLWRWLPGVFLGLLAATAVPHMVAWRVTADHEGLWLDGLKGPRHIAWEHLRLVRVDGNELKIDSTRRDFMEWTLLGTRWRRMERRFGRVHRQDRMAAEIGALWKDPARRPAESADARRRGGPLWPYGAVAALLWTALLFVLP